MYDTLEIHVNDRCITLFRNYFFMGERTVRVIFHVRLLIFYVRNYTAAIMIYGRGIIAMWNIKVDCTEVEVRSAKCK